MTPVRTRGERDRRGLAWLSGGLVLASALVLWPFLPWIILAVWGAVFARHLHGPMTRWFGGRRRLAAVVTLVVLTLFVVPAAVLVTMLVTDAIALVERLMSTDRVQVILRQLVSGDADRPRSVSDLVELVMSQGARAWGILQQIAGTAAYLAIGLVIGIAGIYAMLVEGDRWYSWIEDHVPISPTALRRLAGAFVETGRGLLIGGVGAGLAQALVATVAYVALGVPQPFALGFLTLVLSVVPAIGTAVVWLPIAAGFALTGRPGAAAVLVIIGFALIGTVDNLVRPYLSRRGHLQLPTFVVLVSMFGGIVVMGAWGVVLGPLIVRLAKESFAIRRDEAA